MKRIATLLLAATFVLGSFAGAQAVDIEVSGAWDFSFEWMGNTGFNDGADGRDVDNFQAEQRIRVQTIFVASENVSGTLFFEIGEDAWGSGGGSDLNQGVGAGPGVGFGAGTDGVNIETRRAYIDFAVPGTELDIRIGLQGLALPSAVAGNPVFNGDTAGVVASYAFNEEFALVGFWARLSDEQAFPVGIGDSSTNTSLDAAGLVLDTNFDGFSIDPYFMYAWVGDNANVTSNMLNSVYGSNATASGAHGDNLTAWWGGVAFELDLFDPLTFGLDFIYSDVDGGDNERNDASGWMVAADLAYKLDWFTPFILGWYASGNDDDAGDGSEQLTTVIPNGFAPTSFGFDGGIGLVTDTVISDSGTGTWGIMLAARDISFIEDVTHVFRVAYYEGTNDEDSGYGANANLLRDRSNSGVYMTDEDSAWEINFDTNYQIYENLAAAIQLGWISLDLDDHAFRRGWNLDDDQDAWRAGMNLTYSF